MRSRTATSVRRYAVPALLSALAICADAQAQGARDLHTDPGFWFGLSLGGASVESRAPAPSAQRGGLAGNLEVGYRFNSQWGAGVDFGGIAPAGGCADWGCGLPSQFAPNFTHVFAFGEIRPRDTGWRLRASAGVSRFCYSRYWSDSAWSWGDFALLILTDDYFFDTVGGSGAYHCAARGHALGGSLSVGYDWAIFEDAPVSMGVRLSAEAANFSAHDDVGLPAFHHRALTFTLNLQFN